MIIKINYIYIINVNSFITQMVSLLDLVFAIRVILLCNKMVRLCTTKRISRLCQTLNFHQICGSHTFCLSMPDDIKLDLPTSSQQWTQMKGTWLNFSLNPMNLFTCFPQTFGDYKWWFAHRLLMCGQGIT